MRPRGRSRVSKYRKPACGKTSKNIGFAKTKLESNAVQDSVGKSKKAPKRHLKSSKASKKGDPTIALKFNSLWDEFRTNFGDHFRHEK